MISKGKRRNLVNFYCQQWLINQILRELAADFGVPLERLTGGTKLKCSI